MPSTVEVASFYDGFRERLLVDYRHGSSRVSAALDFAREVLTDAGSILDVGCGIGWSSSEMAATGAEVTGMDLSPALIETARGLFGDRCSFVEGDFVDAAIDRQFDAILMVDVYEHFPREHRPRVHAQIRKALGERLVLTVPTQSTMQYARDNGIALQIIDEDVTDEDVAQLADDIGGTVVVDRLVTIYRPSDYRHVLVVR